jgi:putative transposase
VTERPPEEKPLPTIWRVPDELWGKIEPILEEHDPPKKTGRPRADRRGVLDAVIFRLRTGCQWNRMPKELPEDATVYRTFQRWVDIGVLDRIWATLVEECEELGGVDWEVAGSGRGDGQGPFWGDLIGANRTDRGKNGVKRSLLVEADGGPLSVVVTGANVVRDDKLLEATIDAIVVERPRPTEEAPQHLCLDKGYDNRPTRKIVEERSYVAHIRCIGEEELDEAGEKRYPARRWVVERTLGWLSKCRALLVRYDKKAANYLGLIKVACILL